MQLSYNLNNRQMMAPLFNHMQFPKGIFLIDFFLIIILHLILIFYDSFLIFIDTTACHSSLKVEYQHQKLHINSWHFACHCLSCQSDCRCCWRFDSPHLSTGTMLLCRRQCELLKFLFYFYCFFCPPISCKNTLVATCIFLEAFLVFSSWTSLLKFCCFCLLILSVNSQRCHYFVVVVVQICLIIILLFLLLYSNRVCLIVSNFFFFFSHKIFVFNLKAEAFFKH